MLNGDGMQPGTKNLKLYQGATDRVTFWMKDKSRQPIDLSGTTIVGYLKTANKTATLTVGNGIIISSTEGKVELVFTPEMKVGMSNKGTWSVKVTWSNGNIWRILEGEANIIPEK